MARALTGEMHADPRGLFAWFALAAGYAVVVRSLFRRSRTPKDPGASIIRLKDAGATRRPSQPASRAR